MRQPSRFVAALSVALLLCVVTACDDTSPTSEADTSTQQCSAQCTCCGVNFDTCESCETACARICEDVEDVASDVMDTADDANSDTSIGQDSTGSDLTDVAEDTGQSDTTTTQDTTPTDTMPPDTTSTDTTPADMGDVGDTTTPPPPGTCELDDDCPDGPCLGVGDPDAGWHTCYAPRWTSLTQQCPPQMPDQCCDAASCDGGVGGACVPGPLWYCGGIMPQPANVCVYDECTSNADCTANTGGICVPEGAFGEVGASCFYGNTCFADADCSSRAGGECRPFFNPCSNRLIGLHCTYDDSACREDRDCAGGGLDFCNPGTDGNTLCDEFFPPP